VYKSLNPGLAVRIYHMLYKDSCEEHKLLASMRREKNSFERMIKERAVSLLVTVQGSIAHALHSVDAAPYHGR
jgi:DNA excision repair protein ERCC-4